MTFEHAEEYASNSPPPPRLPMFARCDARGWLLEEDLEGLVEGEGRELLLSIRMGEPIRCCECMPQCHLRAVVGSFVGFCMRRKVVVVRVESGLEKWGENGMQKGAARGADGCLVCVEPCRLRRPDEVTGGAEYAEMLRTLMAVGASVQTLRHAITKVRATHLLCGSKVLTDVEALISALTEEQSSMMSAPQSFEAPAALFNGSCPQPRSRHLL